MMSIFKAAKALPKTVCKHEFVEHVKFRSQPMTEDHLLRAEYAVTQRCALCAHEILEEKWVVVELEDGDGVEHNGAFPGAPFIKQTYWQ